MKELFDIVFLKDAFNFLSTLDRKHYEKILYNIRKAQTAHDPELFKKLNDEIWNSERCIRDRNIGCLLFGTKQMQKIHW